MSSFHDQIFSEIESARKLAAEFANRHGRRSVGSPRAPKEEDRHVQQEAAAAEIAALAAEEERLTREARERAVLRAKASAETNPPSGEIREARPGTAPQPAPVAAAQPTKFRWNAMAILNGLAKLRAKERSAAEELIGKARAIRARSTPVATVSAQTEDARGPEIPPAAPVRGMWMPSHGAAQQWFFTSGGTRCGPVTFAELRTMATSRVLDPRHDRVWKQGMEDWKQAGLLDGLFERRSVPAETPDQRPVKPPGKIAALPTQLNAALASKHMSWPGVGRFNLWLGLLLFPPIWSEILRWSGPTLVATFGIAAMEKLFPWLALLPVPVLLYLVLNRFVNLGMSRWWALGLAVPIVNLWLAFRCLFCPPGHAHHRKLDRAGLATAVAMLVVLPAALWIELKHPGLLSPAGALGEIRSWIAKAGQLSDLW
jgi:hypothetical protein